MVNTVDGRSPAPVGVGSISQPSPVYFLGFWTSQVVIAGFLNHQQYHKGFFFTLLTVFNQDSRQKTEFPHTDSSAWMSRWKLGSMVRINGL